MVTFAELEVFQIPLMALIFLGTFYLQIRLTTYIYNRFILFYLLWEHGAERLRLFVSNYFFNYGWQKGFLGHVGEATSYLAAGVVLVVQVIAALLLGILQLYISFALAVLASSALFGTPTCTITFSCGPEQISY